VIVVPQSSTDSTRALACRGLVKHYGDVAAVARKLLDSLVTDAEPRNREIKAARAHARAAERFGTT